MPDGVAHPVGEERRPPSGGVVPQLFRDHVPLMASGAAVVLIAGRFLLTSRGNVTTALGLLQETSPAIVILGTLITGAQLLALGLWMGLLQSSVLAWRHGRRRIAVQRLGLCGGVLVVQFLIVPLGTALWMTLIVGFVAHAFWRRWNEPHDPSPPRSLASWLITVIPLAVLATLALLATYWWPQENIRLTDGTVRSYMVISSSPDGDTVLMKDSVLSRVATKSIVSRRYCESHQQIRIFRQTAWELMSPDQYERCR